MAKNTPGTPDKSHRATRLRQQAEEFLRTAPRDIEAMSAEAIQVLVHELQVHQVELEMQNEELHRVQHDLEESRDQYQDLFDFAPVGYLSLDQAGRVVQVNLTAASLLGVDRAQLLGTALARFVASDDRDIFHLHRQAVKDRGRHVCELRIRPQHGKQEYVRLETRAVQDKTQNKTTLVQRVALLIITEQKQAEERFRQLLESTPDAMIVLDSQDRIMLANAQMEQVFGYTRQELLGQPVEMLLPQRFRHTHTAHRVRYFANPASRPMGTGLDLCGLHRDGTEFPIEVSLGSLETETGLFVSAAIRNISERKRLHEQEQLLIASDRLVSLGELAASLAHEFNNPLGIAMGFAQNLLSEAEPSDPSYHRLQIIESQIRRCGQLLKNLGDLARTPQAHRIPTDLAALVRQSLGLVAGRLSQHKIETQLDLAANLDPLAVDPQQLEQVLLNLYFNAIEAMPDGGTLTVRVWKHQATEEAAQEAAGAEEAGAGPGAGRADEQRGHEEHSEVRIAVIDTGLGIASNHRTQIFRPFFTTKKQRGMGLGLSICDSIMRAHAGYISIDSTPGQGSTVLLHFPIDVPIDTPIVEGPHDNHT